MMAEDKYLGKGKCFEQVLLDRFKQDFQGKIDDSSIRLLSFWLEQAIEKHNKQV